MRLKPLSGLELLYWLLVVVIIVAAMGHSWFILEIVLNGLVLRWIGAKPIVYSFTDILLLTGLFLGLFCFWQFSQQVGDLHEAINRLRANNKEFKESVLIALQRRPAPGPTKTCPECGHLNPESALVCEDCSNMLRKIN